METYKETASGLKVKKSATDYFTPQIVLPAMIAIVVVAGVVIQVLK